MKSLPKILLSLCAVAGISACVKQSPDLDDCETGVRLLFDWVSSAVRNDTDSLNVRITGSAGNYSMNAAPGGRDIEILPGSYRFTAWETASNVTVDGTTVTVSSTGGAADEPQEFTAGTITDDISNQDGYQTVTVPMYQQTRDLIIRLRFTGDGVSLIRNASGSVDGIALSREMIYGFPPVDGRLRPVAITDGSVGYEFLQADDGWYMGRRTLLGIDGDSDQTLSLTIGFDEGYTTDGSVEITADLNPFHTQDIGEPWVISLSVEVGATFEMVIVDWYSGSESWLEAE